MARISGSGYELKVIDRAATTVFSGRFRWLGRVLGVFVAATVALVMLGVAPASAAIPNIPNIWFADVSGYKGNYPTQVAFSPDGKIAYSTNGLTNSVSVIDAVTHKQIKHVQGFTGDAPYGVAFTPDGKTAYVANQFSNSVTVIDTTYHAQVQEVKGFVGERPTNLEISPDGRFAYVGNMSSNSVSVIDVAEHAQVGEVKNLAVRSPLGIAFSPDGSTAYIGNRDHNNGGVAVVDVGTHTQTATVSNYTGRTPSGMAFTPDGKFAYITSYGVRGQVAVVDATTHEQVGTIAGLYTVFTSEVAFSPDGDTAYIASFIDKSVLVVDVPTHTQKSMITGLSYSPTDVAVNPDGSAAYVTSFAVSVISGPHTAPRVTHQPTDVTAEVGEEVEFVATARALPAPTVRWQIAEAGSEIFTDVPGEASDTMRVTVSEDDNGSHYRARFSNDLGVVTTAPAVLNVASTPEIPPGGNPEQPGAVEPNPIPEGATPETIPENGPMALGFPSEASPEDTKNGLAMTGFEGATLFSFVAIILLTTGALVVMLARRQPSAAKRRV
ncbi:beta-propeller fold lactonase family protein [Lysinibacter sp. HNR]|uniref:beta-propeller fold lactonase family protein n=1 Tax=Lysinibacter sp. HNR TaxID=3031408 RepID=UPI0024357DEB|nr:beta-propeller fold lactonase family protein [Lysinibacter sp. HNR]WGD37606.1 beta-propeller fold lactonase family protein [Lysinibacter sp. HNR]